MTLAANDRSTVLYVEATQSQSVHIQRYSLLVPPAAITLGKKYTPHFYLSTQYRRLTQLRQDHSKMDADDHQAQLFEAFHSNQKNLVYLCKCQIQILHENKDPTMKNHTGKYTHRSCLIFHTCHFFALELGH